MCLAERGAEGGAGREELLCTAEDWFGMHGVKFHNPEHSLHPLNALLTTSEDSLHCGPGHLPAWLHGAQSVSWDPRSLRPSGMEDGWRCTSPLWREGKDGLSNPSATLSQRPWSPRSVGHVGKWKAL